eukprot:6595141-Prymnesium_polylepis.1
MQWAHLDVDHALTLAKQLQLQPSHARANKRTRSTSPSWAHQPRVGRVWRGLPPLDSIDASRLPQIYDDSPVVIHIAASQNARQRLPAQAACHVSLSKRWSTGTRIRAVRPTA